MGDDDGGTALQDAFQRVLDEDFGVGVDVGGGLVQDEDAGVADNGAGEAEQLPLSDAQIDPALGKRRVIALLQGHDEVVGSDGLSGGDHLCVTGVGMRVADVFLDGARKTDKAPAGPCSSGAPATGVVPSGCQTHQ